MDSGYSDKTHRCEQGLKNWCKQSAWDRQLKANDYCQGMDQLHYQNEALKEQSAREAFLTMASRYVCSKSFDFHVCLALNLMPLRQDGLIHRGLTRLPSIYYFPKPIVSNVSPSKLYDLHRRISAYRAIFEVLPHR